MNGTNARSATLCDRCNATLTSNEWAMRTGSRFVCDTCLTPSEQTARDAIKGEAMSTAIETDPRILSEERLKQVKQQYETPKELFNWARNIVQQFGIYGFGIDVAASEHNRKTKMFFFEQQNSLTAPWGTGCNDPNRAAWCNPPFALTKQFLPRAHNQALQGCFSVILTQSDSSVRWWVEAMKHATARIDIHPRVNFIQHPDFIEHMKATKKKISGNPGGNTLWIFNPYDIDRPGGARLVTTGPWKEE